MDGKQNKGGAGRRPVKPSGSRPRSGGSSRPTGKPGERSSRPTGKPGERSSRPTGKPGERSSRPTGKPGERSSRPTGKPGERSDAGRRSGSGDRRSDARLDRRPDTRGRRDERPGAGADRIRDPRIPDEIRAEDLDKGILLELRTLPEGLAETVARHLVAAERAMEAEDFRLARAHIAAAQRRAARVAPVREAAAIAAYRDGDYSAALAELRTVRRMSGGSAYLPMMADCERGMGRPQKALDFIRRQDLSSLDAETKVELLIVAAGARADLGQIDAAVVTLRIPELTRLKPGTTRARLQYAYSDLLARAGRRNEAWEWMERAAGSDIDGVTDAVDRCEEFAGVLLSEESADPASG